MADVLEILVSAYERNPSTVADPAAMAASTSFREMRDQIAREKEA
jgi:hypothetical protein